jgi:hypothetical protein
MSERNWHEEKVEELEKQIELEKRRAKVNINELLKVLLPWAGVAIALIISASVSYTVTFSVDRIYDSTDLTTTTKCEENKNGAKVAQ